MLFIAAFPAFQLGHEQAVVLANINDPKEIATGKSRMFLPGAVGGTHQYS